CFTIFGRVAKELFPSSPKRRVNFELIVFRDKGSGCIDVSNVGPVTNFCHCIYTRQFKIQDTRQPPLMLFVITQCQNSGTEKAPLNAALNLHGRVSMEHFSESCDIATGIFLATKSFGIRFANELSIS